MIRPPVLFRHSNWDALLVIGAVVHGIVLVRYPSVALIAVALWWNANSVAHYFIHLPFFTHRWQNRFFSAFLTLLLGVPQRLWRDRHLAHHAGIRWRVRYSNQLAFESALVGTLWAGMILMGGDYFIHTYLPGWGIGLLLCRAHGYFEHYRGTLSYYGAVYNLALFNDGLHIEHHLRPGLHWRKLREVRSNASDTSALPAVLRWFELFTLEGLERFTLSCPALCNWMVRVHSVAIRRLIANGTPRRIAVVGGGLFPRTPLIMQQLFPSAELWVVDVNGRNLDIARHRLDGRAICVHSRFPLKSGHFADSEFDLVTIPLAYDGDREALYSAPPAKVTLVHDWIWRRRGSGAVVSWLLLKRINCVSA